MVSWPAGAMDPDKVYLSHTLVLLYHVARPYFGLYSTIINPVYILWSILSGFQMTVNSLLVKVFVNQSFIFNIFFAHTYLCIQYFFVAMKTQRLTDLKN